MKFSVLRTSNWGTGNLVSSAIREVLPNRLASAKAPRETAFVECFTMEFANLEELVAFAADDSIIITGIDERSGLPGLEIYDDYRE